jgi:hypothetical protein
MTARYHWIKTIVEDDNGEFVLDIKEACEELGWQAGDVIEWIDNNDGTWTIKKKEDSCLNESVSPANGSTVQAK